MKTTITLVFAICVCIVGCAEPEFEDASKGLKESKVLASEFRTWQLEADVHPNEYSLTAKSSAENSTFRLSRVGETAASLAPASVNGTDFIFRKLEGGATYQVTELSTSGNQISAATVSVPLDLEVRDLSSGDSLGLSESVQIGRIFFTEGGEIVTNGLPLSLTANEIIGSDSRISAFSEVSPYEPKGRQASDIEVKVSKVTGHFSISARGEKGVKGNEGLKGEEGPQGSEGPMIGIDGWTVNGLEVGRFCSFSGDAEFGGATASRPSEKEWNEGHLGRGGKGGTGKVGGIGGDGYIGGASASVRLTLPGDQLSKVSIDVQGGTGGEGGIGGMGGDGGPGGPGGVIFGNGPCRPSPIGPLGDRGPRGPTGPTGSTGATGKILVNGVVISGEVLR